MTNSQTYKLGISIRPYIVQLMEDEDRMVKNDLKRVSEVLEKVHMNGVESAEKGIYIPLPEVEALSTLKELVLGAVPDEFSEITAKDMPLSKVKREGYNSALRTVKQNLERILK